MDWDLGFIPDLRSHWLGLQAVGAGERAKVERERCSPGDAFNHPLHDRIRIGISDSLPATDIRPELSIGQAHDRRNE